MARILSLHMIQCQLYGILTLGDAISFRFLNWKIISRPVNGKCHVQIQISIDAVFIRIQFHRKTQRRHLFRSSSNDQSNASSQSYTRVEGHCGAELSENIAIDEVSTWFVIRNGFECPFDTIRRNQTIQQFDSTRRTFKQTFSKNTREWNEENVFSFLLHLTPENVPNRPSVSIVQKVRTPC